MDYSTILDFKNALLSINKVEVKNILEDNYHNNMKNVEWIVFNALEELGKDWEEGRASLSQVYMSGILVEDVMEHYFDNKKTKVFTDANIGICVLDDYHSLGKSIVSSLMGISGFRLTDLGAGLSVNDAYEAAVREELDILLVSVLMLSSARKLTLLTGMFKENKKNIKVIAGGAPFRFSETLAKETGVDLSCHTASEIFDAIREVMGDE